MNPNQHTDVLVLGAGASGVAAAISAARMGLKVTLVERNQYPGGKATAAEVGTICGLYKYSKKEIASYSVKGFARSFAEALQQNSNSCPLSNTEGLHYLPYDVDVFKQLCLELLEAHKVETHFATALDQVELKDGLVSSISTKSQNSSLQFDLRSIVDCSGDSLVSQATQIPLIKSDHYQAAAQVFTLKNVPEENEAKLGMILMKTLRSAIDNHLLPDFYDRVYIVQGSLKNNKVSLKLGIPVPVTYEPGNLEAIQDAAQHFVSTLTDFLTRHVGAFKDATIEHIAPETGMRVGLRTEGDYILTENDILTCRKFTDAIAIGSWPIEEWQQQKRVKMSYFSLDDFYQVPARCLHSKYIQNLYMGGRNISASTAAIASARVMGICLQTGYAAGFLAAGYALDIPRERTINRVQNEQL